jgi:hypothetical protein
MSGQSLPPRRTRQLDKLAKWIVIPVTACIVAILPGFLSAQQPGSNQGVPPKSPVPPATKKETPPPPASGGGGGQVVPPLGGAAAKTPAGPMPQGPIKNDDDPRVKAAVARAVNYFRQVRYAGLQVGELSLMVHALAKAHEKYPDVIAANDPVFLGAVERLRQFCPSDGFRPSRQNGPDNYEAGCAAMALAAVDGQAYKNEINSITQYILSKMQTNGSWTYGPGIPGGDTSMTQYSILGLWEASSAAGISIPRETWDKISQWLVSTQHGDGGFEYHPPDKSVPNPQPSQEATHTMTVASLGSLYICRDHIGGKRKNTRGILLNSQEDEKSDTNYKPNTKPDQFESAINRGIEWVKKNFTLDRATGEGNPDRSRWFFYYLYAFERFATLGEVKTINNVDWYTEGAQLVLSKQQGDGSWHQVDGTEANTAFAVLFLVRSTQVSVKIHQRRIGRGTLISGRGLPQNLAELEQTATGFKAKAIRGKTVDLLQMLETGKQDQLEGAAIGLIKQMYEDKEKWTAVSERADQLKKIYERGLKLKNAEMLKASMKGLALTGDYRVVPILIDGMYYEADPEVQLDARLALCKISRKFNGFGTIYPAEATKEEWEEEIARWKDWYRMVRPESAFEDDVEIGGK